MTLPDPGIVNRPLPYAKRLDSRVLASIDLIIIHCTELPDLATAREYGEAIHYPESASGNSGHYYVERSGEIEQWVPLCRIAHHTKGMNERSIGIELVNEGRYPDWFNSKNQLMQQAYPDAQISSLIRLLAKVLNICPSIQHITGHEQLDRSLVTASDNSALKVFRKCDPGPLFPWPRVLAQSGLAFLDPE